MKNILVTGGCGFIGSNFINLMLNNYPYRIINLDKLTYAGNRENLRVYESSTKFDYEFFKGDICDKETVRKILRNHHVDAIINFAAESHVDKSNREGSIKNFRRTNVIGTSVLLEEARKTKVNKFLQVSTDEVYGSIKEGSFNENSDLNPSNPYSITKAEAEKVAFLFSNDLKVIITRSSNNFGPYQYPEKLIPLTITNVLLGKKIPVYGDGKQVRDWLYVEDNCDAIHFILNRGKNGEIYNITTKNGHENIWLIRKILKIMGEKEEEFVRYVKDRPNHDQRYSIDNKKIIELGWSEKNNFMKSLERTVLWYMHNKLWWKKIRNKPEFKRWYDDFYIKERRLK